MNDDAEFKKMMVESHMKSIVDSVYRACLTQINNTTAIFNAPEEKVFFQLAVVSQIVASMHLSYLKNHHESDILDKIIKASQAFISDKKEEL